MKQIKSEEIIASLIANGREDEALEMHRFMGIDTAEGYLLVIGILSERGDDHRVIDLARSGASQFPANPQIHENYIEALMREGQAAQAASVAESFMARTQNEGLWAMWAESLMRAYEFEKAGNVLNQYMPQNPYNAGAWLVTARLLWLHTLPGTADVLKGLEQEINGTPVEYNLDQGRMHFAAGLLREAMGDLQGAWASFTRGNEVFQATEMGEPFEEVRLARQLEQHITHQWIAQNSLEIGLSPQPVFIVGSPASGIADLYSVATADGSLGRAGEPRMLERDLRRLCGDPYHDGYAQCLSKLGKGDLENIKSRYLEVVRDRIKGAAIFVDGLGSNLRHAGVLKAIFPNAIFLEARAPRMQKILDLYRMPLDPRAHRFASDLQLIKTSLDAQDEIARHWAQIMGDTWVAVEGSKRKAVAAHIPEWTASGQGASLTSSAGDWPDMRAASRQKYSELSGQTLTTS